MRKKIVLCLSVLLALSVILILLAGCAPRQANELTLGDDAGGKQVTLKADQTLTVRLESNPTTGYGWEIAEVDDAVLKSQGEPQFEQQNSSKQLAGAGGWQVFHFTALKTGETNLKLVYRRPWEKNIEPIKTFTVQVVIQ